MAIFSNVVLLCLISVVFSAIATMLTRKILIRKEYGSNDFLPVNFGITLLLLFLMAPWFWSYHPGPDSWKWLIAMCAVDFFVNWIGFKAVAQVKASSYALAIAFSPLITILLVALLKGGHALSAAVLGGTGAIILGLSLVAWSKNDHSNHDRWRLLLLPAITTVLFGVLTYLTKEFMSSGDISSYSYMLIRYVFLFLSMALILRPKRWKKCLQLSWRITFVRCVVVIVSWWTMAQALLVGDLVVVKSLTDSAPIFVAVFSILTGFEKPKRLELLGIVIATLGIMAIIRFS